MKIELRAEHNDNGTWKAETLVDGHGWGRGDELDREGVAGLLDETIASAPALSWSVSDGAWSFDGAQYQGGT